MVDYGNAIKRPFTDFGKLVIGVIISIIPIINLFVKGYFLESSGVSKKRVSRKKLPEWKNWGNLFVKGLLSSVIGFVYLLPALVIIMIGVGLAFSSLVETFIPLIPQEYLENTELLETPQAETELGNIFKENWMLAVPTLLKASPFVVIGGLLAILGVYLTPIAVLNYVKSEKLGDAFQFGAVFRKSFQGKYLVVWLMTVIFSAIVGFTLSFIPIVGAGLAFFWAGMFTYTVIGEIYPKL